MAKGLSKKKLPNKKTNKISKPTKDISKDLKKVGYSVVTVDAPSGEGKEMQLRTAMTHKALLEALEEYRGHIKNACALVGVTRETYYQYMKDPDFAKAVEAIKEGITDEYVEALHTVAVQGKFFPAIKYHLDNHAQGRGYGKEAKAIADAAKNSGPPVSNVQINLATLSPEVLRQLKQSITIKDESK